MRLGVNIDHVATLRQARKGIEPDLLKAALIAQSAGADQITVHLRCDRRHIQDEDVRILRSNLKIPLNIECSTSKEMRELIPSMRPQKATLVPERKSEITTEGGLDVIKAASMIQKFIKVASPRGITVGIFVDPVPEQVQACIDLEVKEIELNTGIYAESKTLEALRTCIDNLDICAKLAKKSGLEVAAGHGLNMKNLPAILKIKEIDELNIGHHIISDAIFVGLEPKIREVLSLIR